MTKAKSCECHEVLKQTAEALELEGKHYDALKVKEVIRILETHYVLRGWAADQSQEGKATNG